MCGVFCEEVLEEVGDLMPGQMSLKMNPKKNSK
jgi:hypothetical protein